MSGLSETGQVLVNGLAFGASLALVAIGLTLIFGVLRVVNFAHGALFMLGAYVTYYLMQAGANYLVALVAAVVALGLLGAGLEFAVFRRFRNRMLEGAVAAIALTLLIGNIGTRVFTGQPRVVHGPFNGALRFGGITLGADRAFVIVCSVVAVVVLHLAVKRTRYGKAMRAVQQDSYAASLQGIDASRVSMLSFAAATMLAGLAGALIAPTQVVTPSMGEAPLLLSFVVIILGGMGSVNGALVAALLIGVVQSATATYWIPQAALWVSFLVAIGILLVRPTGLFGRA